MGNLPKWGDYNGRHGRIMKCKDWAPTWDVPECPCDAIVLVVDDERTETSDKPPVPHLALACSHTSGLVHLLTNSNGKNKHTHIAYDMIYDMI